MPQDSHPANTFGRGTQADVEAEKARATADGDEASTGGRPTQEHDAALAETAVAQPSPDREPPPRAAGPSADDDPLPGMVIGERYEILRRLGAGGMGAVYLARHTVLDSRVAIKVLVGRRDDETQLRFLREARVASRIKHPNTVSLFDFGVLPDGRLYLAMEYLDGKTLAQGLAQGALPPQRACRIALQIAQGIQAAHDCGVVHRDLKPDNIFLLSQRQADAADVVKIVDFGIAKDLLLPAASEPPQPPGFAALPRLPGVTASGTILGTPYYLAPEQAGSREVDARADQYALGCVLFEMLTAAPPFRGRSVQELLDKHMHEAPPRPTEIAPALRLPVGLEALLARLLQKSPEARFPSMQEVAAALIPFCTGAVSSEVGDGIKAHPTSVSRPRRRWYLGGALALGAIGLIAGATLRSGRRAGEIKTTAGTRELLESSMAAALLYLQESAKKGPLELRLEAIAALGESQAESVPELLYRLLGDPLADVRAQAARALGRSIDFDAVSRLDVLLQDRTLGVRLAAAAALAELGHRRGQSFLAQAQSSSDPEARVRAAMLLCDQGLEVDHQVLLDAVKQGAVSSSVAVGILGCLGRSAQPEPALARLRSEWRAATGVQKIVIAVPLAQSGDAEASQFLRSAAHRNGSEQLLAAREAAALEAEAGLAELFRTVLRSPGPAPAAVLLALQGLGQAGVLSDLPLLSKRLEPGNPDALRQAAAIAILRLCSRCDPAPSERGLRWARVALRSPDWALRESAVVLLSGSTEPSSLALIGEMLRDGDVRVRRAAVRALGSRADRAALYALRSGLADPDESVRLDVLRAIGQVGKLLGEGRVAGLLREVSAWLKELIHDGNPKVQLLASSTLLLFGDETQREILMRAQATADGPLRQWLAQNAELPIEWLASLLSDPEEQVRIAAALRLAEHGDRRALSVLTAALTGEGAEAVRAFSALRRMGEAVSEPAALQLLMTGTGSIEQRLALVAALGTLPVPLTQTWLLRATRDPEPRVRMRAAEVASELALDRREITLTILRLLSLDRDAGVRQRALTALGRFRPPVQGESTGPGAKGLEPDLVETGDPKTQSLDLGEPEGASPQPQEPGAAGRGVLVIHAPPGENLYLDGRSIAGSQTSGLELPVGRHQLRWSAGEQKVEVLAGQRTLITIEESPVQRALKQIFRALEQKNPRAAAQLLQQTSDRCEGAQAPAACGFLSTELSFARGKLLLVEGQRRESIAEFERVLRPGARERLPVKQRAEAERAVATLSGQLARIIIRTQLGDKCKEDRLWVNPEPQSVKVDGAFVSITPHGGQVLTLGTCR